MPIVYGELRRIAHAQLRGERPGHTLNTTALVHEAYLKLTNLRQVEWRDRAHFFAMAARLMRRILIDYARARKRDKRGGDAVHIPLAEALDIPGQVGGHVSLTDAVSVSASYTWYNFAIRQNIPGNVLAANTPRNKGTVSLAYAGRHGIDADVDARIVSGYRWTSGVWDGDVPASQTVNVHAAYRVSPQLGVYAYGTNIFDQQRFQFFGGSVIGRRALAGMTATL